MSNIKLNKIACLTSLRSPSHTEAVCGRWLLSTLFAWPYITLALLSINVLDIRGPEILSPTFIDVTPCGMLICHVVAYQPDKVCRQKVYQSALQTPIIINGTGFTKEMELILDPPLVSGEDYNLEVVSDTAATLHLVAGKKWRHVRGPLYVTAIRISGTTHLFEMSQLLNGEMQTNDRPVLIALVLADPVILPTKRKLYYETHSKRIDLDVLDLPSMIGADCVDHPFNHHRLSATLTPTTAGHYFARGTHPCGIQLTLILNRNSDVGWLPAELSLNKDPDAANKQVPLMLTSINTGAGDYPFDPPLIVGYVIRDREGVRCTDTCGAFNGRCNDGTLPDRRGDYYTGCDIGRATLRPLTGISVCCAYFV